MKKNGTSDDPDGRVVSGFLSRVRLTVDPGLVLRYAALRFLDGHDLNEHTKSLHTMLRSLR